MEYSYWYIEFTSCEGNYRWTIARAPSDWEDWEVRDRVPMGGCGDDVAEIISISESYDEDYCWTFVIKKINNKNGTPKKRRRIHKHG